MKKLLLLILITTVLIANAANNGFLGTTINDFKSDKLTGVLVNDVIDNSAAQKFGIKINDIITAVNDITVQSKDELVKILSTYNLGDVVNISYVRNGVAATKNVILGKRPEAIKYQMKKSIQDDGEHWYFSNDKTEIVVKTDNTPVSITQTDDNGKVISLKFATTSFNNILQKFSDVEDKLLSIKKNKKQQDECSCKCPITDFTLYKITPEVEAVSSTKTLIVDKFTIAPNPTDGRFVIDFASKETGALLFSIVDITGRTVKSENVQGFDGYFTKQINLENEAKGAYFIQFQIGDKMSTKKIVLQ